MVLSTYLVIDLLNHLHIEYVNIFISNYPSPLLMINVPIRLARFAFILSNYQIL
jgi:hypothetical protein